MTENQIFSRPARPNSVNKHFIIWTISVEVLVSTLMGCDRRAHAEVSSPSPSPLKRKHLGFFNCRGGTETQAIIICFQELIYFRVWFTVTLSQPHNTLVSCSHRCNYWHLGDRNDSSRNQTSSSSRKRAIFFRMVALGCNTHDHLLHHSRCSVDCGLRIYSLGFGWMDRACPGATGFHIPYPIPPVAVIQQFLLLCSSVDFLRSISHSTSELHPRAAAFVAYEYGERHHEVFLPFCSQCMCVCPCDEKTVLTVRAVDSSTY